MGEIFSGGRPAPFGIALNIAQSDWVAWAKAMSGVEKTVRASIMRDAAQQALKTSGKENEFWTAVHYGCR